MTQRPNFVVMFLDDSGWGDFRPFGETPYPTPNVERLAAAGCCFQQFYVPQAICSASRASLLTGCYPGRHHVYGALPPRVRGLDPAFTTMGETLQQAGYTTACFGKWHVGDQPDTRPPARGFSESAGLMYSNDMWKHHPEVRVFDDVPLQYWRSGEIVIDDVSPKQQRMLTTWYTEEAVDFIHRNHDQPFFLYVPHNMPHVPLYCSPKFADASGRGLYADVMMEIDWSLGQILDALEETGVDQDTVVVFTSDNGPWLSYGNHAGTTPFREGKSTGFDGGTRSACVMAYPRELWGGTISQSAFCSVDLLPTFARLADAKLPEHPIDGMDVWDLLSGQPGAVNPHDYYPFSTARTFEGVISGDGRWKLHLPHTYKTVAEVGSDGRPGRYEEAFIDLSLFDMTNDPYETTNVLEDYPDTAAKLERWAREHQAFWWTDLGRH